MLTRQLALLCSLAILAGLFLPWIATPIGNNLVPWDVLPAFDRTAVEEYLRSATPETLVFLGSFCLAALFLFFSIVGLERRWLAFLTGAAPVGFAAWIVWQNREPLNLAAVELTMEGTERLFLQASGVLGPGGWAWICGAAVLLLLALFDPGRPTPRSVTTSRW
jgi:exosortase/archaeosortase